MSPGSIYPGISSAPAVKATLCIFKATPLPPQAPPNPVLYCYLHLFCNMFLLPKQSVSECRSPAQLYYGCPVPVKAHPKTVKPLSGPLPVLPDAHSGLRGPCLCSQTPIVASQWHSPVLRQCLVLCLFACSSGHSGLFFLPLPTGGSLAAIRRFILVSFQAFGMGTLCGLPMPHWLSQWFPPPDSPVELQLSPLPSQHPPAVTGGRMKCG